MDDNVVLFQRILAEHQGVGRWFPLVYLGFGRALCLLHRYLVARPTLELALSAVNEQQNLLQTYKWPGTSKCLEESQPQTLKVYITH